MHTLIEEEVSEKTPPAAVETEAVEKEEKFFPTGGIAFFFALIVLCLLIWFGIYFLMIERI